MHDVINVPNLLSIVRIILTPFIILFLFGGMCGQVISIVLFTIAAITDRYDGYIARKNRIVSKFGTFIDPLADKILIISMFSIFAYRCAISWWIVVSFIIRDLLVTQMRVLILKSGGSLKTSFFAKIKTVLQFIGIYLLFLQMLLHECCTKINLVNFDLLISYFIYGVALFSIYTCFDYVIQYLRTTRLGFKFYFFYFISSFFYVGLCPIAPGSVGSLVGLVLIYFLPNCSIFFNISVAIALFFVGVITTGYMERTLAIHDPKWAVIDEVLGIFLTVFWLPKKVTIYLIAFSLFRFFDIAKPFPITSIEDIRRPGWGIMLDDVAAAVYASLVCFVIIKKLF